MTPLPCVCIEYTYTHTYMSMARVDTRTPTHTYHTCIDMHTHSTPTDTHDTLNLNHQTIYANTHRHTRHPILNSIWPWYRCSHKSLSNMKTNERKKNLSRPHHNQTSIKTKVTVLLTDTQPFFPCRRDGGESFSVKSPHPYNGARLSHGVLSSLLCVCRRLATASRHPDARIAWGNTEKRGEGN